MYFDRNATMSGANRRGSAGMDRRSNAAWVLPQAARVAKRDCESKRLVRTATIPRSHRRGAEQGEQSDWPSSAFR